MRYGSLVQFLSTEGSCIFFDCTYLYLIRFPQSFEWPAPRNFRFCRIVSLQCLRCPANSSNLSSTMFCSPVLEQAAPPGSSHHTWFQLSDLVPKCTIDFSDYTWFQQSHLDSTNILGIIHHTYFNHLTLFQPSHFFQPSHGFNYQYHNQEAWFLL